MITTNNKIALVTTPDAQATSASFKSFALQRSIIFPETHMQKQNKTEGKSSLISDHA